MKRFFSVLVLLFAVIPALAVSTRILDGQQITNGSATLTLPTTTDTLTGNASTQTLTNKTMSGSSNTFSNIPTSAISSGTPWSISQGGTNNSTAYTSGSLIFSNGTSLTQDNSKLFWDDTNFRLGIATATPGYPLDIETATNNPAAFIDNTTVVSGGSATGGATLGLSASPGSAMAVGSRLGNLNFWGYDGSTLVKGAGIQAFAAANTWSGTSSPASLLFYTSGAASHNLLTLALTLDSSQNATFAGSVTAGTGGFIGNVTGNASGTAANVTGTVAVGNGGTGQTTLTSGAVLIGNGTSGVTSVAPGTNGNVLTNVGGVWTSSAPTSTAPALNGGSASPESVTASGGITLSGITYTNFVWVGGSGGAVTVTATPSVTACTADGQMLYIIGTSNTNTVTLQDAGTLSSSKLRINGNWVGAQYSQLALACNGATTEWFEISRR